MKQVESAESTTRFRHRKAVLLSMRLITPLLPAEASNPVQSTPSLSRRILRAVERRRWSYRPHLTPRFQAFLSERITCVSWPWTKWATLRSTPWMEPVSTRFKWTTRFRRLRPTPRACSRTEFPPSPSREQQRIRFQEWLRSSSMWEKKNTRSALTPLPTEQLNLEPQTEAECAVGLLL